MRPAARAISAITAAALSLVAAVAPVPAAAGGQSAATAAYKVNITHIDASAFPQISTFLALSAPNGLRVPGLTKSAFTLLENSSPVVIHQISEEEIGLQLAVVVESSNVFSKRDINTITRLDYVKTALINFAVGEGNGGNPYMKDVVDSVSIFAPEGPIVQNSSVGGEIRNALISYQSEFRFETGLFNLIAQAMDNVTAAGSHPGMKRELVVFTSGIDASADAEVSAIAARANTEGLTIHTVLVGPPASQYLPLAENVQALAELTSGSYRYFDSPAVTNQIWDTLVSQRVQYRVVYRSGLNQSGQHTLQALANLNGESVLSPSKDFALALQPPTITLVEVPAEITRTTDQRGADPATLDPRQQKLLVKIDFPDGHPRNLAKLQLIVDNAVTDEVTSGSFSSLTWDLTGYGETGTHGLQAYVVDELGLEARSSLLNVIVQVNIPPPITDAAAPFALGAIVVVVAVLAIVALVAAITVLRRPTVITSIVHHTGSRSKETTEPFVPTPHRGAARPKQGKAYLERLDEAAPGPHPNIELVGDNLRLGRDETLVQITIDDKSVSRLHARISEEADGLFFIHDEGSTSGTWVNYNQVSLSGQQLRHGDVINLGRVQLRFSLRYPAAPVPPGVKHPTPARPLVEHSTEPFEPTPVSARPAADATAPGVKPGQPAVQDEYHTEAFTPTFDDNQERPGKP